MGSPYYQFCPVAKAMEVLDERWTLLIVRELARSRDWWLVIMDGEADVCDDDPGHEVAVTVTASLRRLTEVWRGDLGRPEALRCGAVEVAGPEELRRGLPRWFTLSPFALVPRPA